MRTGFTLVEILIALAILSIIAALGLFASMGAYHSYHRYSQRELLLDVLAQARSHAMNNRDELPWGVCRDSGQYVLFAGTPAGPQSERFPAAAPSTVPDCAGGGIIFAQLTGTTTPATIAITEAGHSSTIRLSYEGRIE